MIKRKIFKSRIKPEYVERYIEYHKNVWPELLDEYRKAGYIKLNCFLNENELIIFLEYDEDIFWKSQEDLAKKDIQIRWQKLMSEVDDATFKSVEYKEVFCMD